MPKTVDTRSHCKVGLRACNNLPQPPPYILVFWGCGRLLHALNHTLQRLLVSTVFGTVSSLHLISFLISDWTWNLAAIFSFHRHFSHITLRYEHFLGHVFNVLIGHQSTISLWGLNVKGYLEKRSVGTAT